MYNPDMSLLSGQFIPEKEKERERGKGKKRATGGEREREREGEGRGGGNKRKREGEGERMKIEERMEKYIFLSFLSIYAYFIYLSVNLSTSERGGPWGMRLTYFTYLYLYHQLLSLLLYYHYNLYHNYLYIFYHSYHYY